MVRIRTQPQHHHIATNLSKSGVTPLRALYVLTEDKSTLWHCVQKGWSGDRQILLPRLTLLECRKLYFNRSPRVFQTRFQNNREVRGAIPGTHNYRKHIGWPAYKTRRGTSPLSYALQGHISALTSATLRWRLRVYPRLLISLLQTNLTEIRCFSLHAQKYRLCHEKTHTDGKSDRLVENMYEIHQCTIIMYICWSL